MSHSLDALIVVPPLSPSDTNPPLGPYLLKRCLKRQGLSLSVVDLSIAYINAFKSNGRTRVDKTLGDQDKDRSATHAAREHYVRSIPVRWQLHTPCSANPLLGMHVGFDELDAMLRRILQPGSYWHGFLEEHLFGVVDEAPAILGLSIMGPPQVPVALAAARMARERWPRTLRVAGGSHVTILESAIRSDSRYGNDVDLFMSGHCENAFVSLAKELRCGCVSPAIGFTAGQGSKLECGSKTELTVLGRGPQFEIHPDFDREAIRQYDAERVTLPMQLTRGCAYAKCSYCTYPAVEQELLNGLDSRVVEAIGSLMTSAGVDRFSFKDSLFTSKNLKRLADLLIKHDLPISWSATTLINGSLTREILDRLAASGCRTLEVGLETIDPLGQELFSKKFSLDVVERFIDDAASAGIVVVINHILGWPLQTKHSALAQIAWHESMRTLWPDAIRASFNMLEVNRGAPMARNPQAFRVTLGGVAPWAFSYSWDAPTWRKHIRFPSDDRLLH